jgi:hypothetical protein
MDRDTKKPKGTAFVEYKSQADAKKAAAACERGRKGTGPGISVGGRQLEVDMAVNQVCVGGSRGGGLGGMGWGGESGVMSEASFTADESGVVAPVAHSIHLLSAIPTRTLPPSKNQDDARNISTGKAANSTLTKDKRNLYLAKEGLIAENTPAWEALSDSDK